MVFAFRFLFVAATLFLLKTGFQHMGTDFIWGAFSMLVFWQVVFRLKNGYWFES